MNGLLWEKEIRQMENVRLLGRFDPRQPAFSMFWTGSGVEICLRCTRLEIELEADYAFQCPWIGVMVDGAPVSRFPLERGRRYYTVLAGMDASVAHTVTVIRDSQPVMEREGPSLRAHRLRSDGELLPPPPRAWQIEFVGDSLTSGEGLLGAKSAMEWRTIWISAMESWAMEVCRAMNAQGRWLSQSGWGVYWSWDGNREQAIPGIYDRVCAVDGAGGAPYDFGANPVHAVVINLGTNDSTALSGLEEAEREAAAEHVKRAAEDFLRRVRARNPDAYILWTYGMCGGEIAPLLRAAVHAVRREGDKRVGYVQLSACPGDQLGSRQHPGRESHRCAARAVVQHLEAVLKR